MANQRRPGQKLIGCQADEALIAQIDQARGRKDRSLFMREAIVEKLRSMGIVVSDDFIYAPDRTAAVVTNVHGNHNKVTNHLSTSPSAVPPRRGAKTAKAGKPRNPRTKK